MPVFGLDRGFARGVWFDLLLWLICTVFFVGTALVSADACHCGDQSFPRVYNLHPRRNIGAFISRNRQHGCAVESKRQGTGG